LLTLFQAFLVPDLEFVAIRARVMRTNEALPNLFGQWQLQRAFLMKEVSASVAAALEYFSIVIPILSTGLALVSIIRAVFAIPGLIHVVW